MHINNHSNYTCLSYIMPDQQGIDTLHLLAQGTYAVDENGHCKLCEQQLQLQTADDYLEDSSNSSLIHPSHIHTGKVATDILVTGLAYAPGQKPVHQLVVDVMVNDSQKRKQCKQLQVFGNRYWRRGQITKPNAFTTMPLSYEYAYGGAYINKQGQRVVHPDNPIGRGFCREGSEAQQLEGELLPNVEDPNHLIQQPTDRPIPVGIGPLSPHWHPRLQYAGTYDEHWQQHQAPYWPADYNPRFQNVAATGLIYNGFLQGGEQIAISNMHPNGTMVFHLPLVILKGSVQLCRQAPQNVSFVLETVSVEPNKLTFLMQWRAMLTLSEPGDQVHSIEIHVANTIDNTVEA